MFHDKMTPAERFKSLHETGYADRPGIAVFATGFVSRMTGNLTIGECYEHPLRYAKAFLPVQQMLGFDTGPHFGHPAFGVREFGGSLTFPRGTSKVLFPVITKRPVNTPMDVDKLEVPDIERVGDFPKQIMAAKYVVENYPVGYRNPMVVVGDAFSWGANIMGLEKLLMLMHDDPPLVQDLMKKIVQVEVDAVKFALEQVGQMTFFEGSPADSNDIITPQQFKQFALPPIIAYRRGAMKAGGKYFIAHPCGDQTKNLEYWAEVPGTHTIHFDFRTPLEAVVAKFAKDMTIAGNIECLQFTHGDAEWVYKKAMTRLKAVARECPHGYVVGPGCELPPNSSPVNVHAMVRATYDYAVSTDWNRR